MAGWGEPPHLRNEWLKTYDHVAVWAHHADLVSLSEVRRLRRSATRDPHWALTVLSELRGLRTATHIVSLHPEDTRAMAVVTGYVRRSGAVVRVEPGSVPRWTFPADVGLELPLLASAWAVADLLTREDLSRVKACPGHDCGWLFVDHRGRRTWCSMSSCGNRSKVARHARRKASRGRA